jgi:hypothetical protein
MNDHLIYAYGVSAGPITLGETLTQKDLTCIFVSGLSVVVKFVPKKAFSEASLAKKIVDTQWLERNAIVHMKVLSALAECGSVLPFKLGTIFTEVENLESFIGEYAETLNDNLAKISGREEWAVKGFVNRHGLAEDLNKGSEIIRNVEQEISKSSSGRSFFLLRKKETLVIQEAQKMIDAFCNRAGEIAESLCVEVRPLSTEFSTPQVDLVFNLACLVNSPDRKQFLQSIRQLNDDRLGHKAVGNHFFIELTGPWPPFSFVNITNKPSELHG